MFLLLQLRYLLNKTSQLSISSFVRASTLQIVYIIIFLCIETKKNIEEKFCILMTKCMNILQNKLFTDIIKLLKKYLK